MGSTSASSSIMALLHPPVFNGTPQSSRKVLVNGSVAHFAPLKLVQASTRRRATPPSFTIRAEDDSVIEQVKQGVDSAIETTKEFLAGTQDKVGQRGKEGGDAMKKETNKASNNIANTTEDARRNVGNATSSIEGKSKDAMSSIKTGADDATSKAKAGLEETKSNMDRQ